MKKLYIGIDAHKNTNSFGLAFDDMKEPAYHGKISADLDCTLGKLRSTLKKYDLKKEDVKICYEAGPTGFVLARRLITLGFECEVIAPSLIPKKSGDRMGRSRSQDSTLALFSPAGIYQGHGEADEA